MKSTLGGPRKEGPMSASASSPALSAAPPRSGFASFVAQLLSDRERFYAEVEAGESLGAKLGSSLLALVSLAALYGAAAGAYAGPAQAAASAVKLPLLF